ncbi:CBD9-like protein [Polyplosphaeria fusca]|uniref:CBD9-like protein n=1 Tax=Polyplosphaeria fusca TaxID=682080 RepID=A0A9P4QN68_9PLEO|nr:CBD9-like protein [Polyplosphaeria fusca]
MRFDFGITWVAAVVGLLSSTAVAAPYYDAETGFTFSEQRIACTLTSNVLFRFAVPNNVPTGQKYDVVLQVVAPNAVGWAGMAWGGSMVQNPLTVGWQNGQNTVTTSRWANSRSTPIAYTGATYEKLTKGNKANGTHWQFTVKCTGCTSWGSSSIDPRGSPKFAWACSSSKPSSPSSNTTSLPVHDAHNYWSNDMSSGANANFADLVTKNGGHNSYLYNDTISMRVRR